MGFGICGGPGINPLRILGNDCANVHILSWVQGHMTVVQGTQEVEEEGSPETRNPRPQCAMIVLMNSHCILAWGT